MPALAMLGGSDFEKAGPPLHHRPAEPVAAVASLLTSCVVRGVLDPGDVVVVAPCGVGLGLPDAAKAVGSLGRVVGLETDPNLVQVARANVRSTGLHNIQIRRWTPPRLPTPDSSSTQVFLDGVVGRPFPDGMCGEVARILRPGGSVRVREVVLTSPDGEPFTGLRDRRLVTRARRGERELVNQFTQAGLCVVAVGSRYVFDRQEVRRLIEAEFCDLPGEQVADVLMGRVWSVVITAAKRPTVGSESTK